jgi:hypothetical protein
VPELFGRACRVVVGAAVGAVRAGLRVDGHRVAFRVEKTLDPKPNQCEVSIWNLSKTQRRQIAELQPKAGEARGIPVLIEAGYKDPGPKQIFSGDLRTAYSEREGADWVTTIESGDGEQARQNARINVSYGPRTSPEVAIRAILRSLGIGEGNIAKTIGKFRAAGVTRLFSQRMIVSGSAAEQLTRFCDSANLEWSIQDGIVQVVDRKETLSRIAVKIDPKHGLVGSPAVDAKGIVTFKALLNARIVPGSLVVLESEAVRGNYRVQRSIWEGDTHALPWYITAEGKRF